MDSRAVREMLNFSVLVLLGVLTYYLLKGLSRAIFRRPLSRLSISLKVPFIFWGYYCVFVGIEAYRALWVGGEAGWAILIFLFPSSFLMFRFFELNSFSLGILLLGNSLILAGLLWLAEYGINRIFEKRKTPR